MILRTVILLAICIVGTDLLGWKNKSTELTCSKNNNKLLSILNILCNNTQNVSITTRDACYGCFFRAGSLPSGSTQLVALSQCATMYLANTSYLMCAQQLQNVVNGIRPTPTSLSPCYAGYCEFVRCVRQNNANQLIDACFLQNLVNRDFTKMLDRITFFTNTTSCILAQTRCNLYNPITGQIQQVPQKFTAQYTYNSLQITPSGDIRIVTFPGTVGVAEFFCSTRTTLEQSTYGNSIC